MWTAIIVILIVLIILGVLGGGIMIFSHLLVAVMHTGWKYLGLIVFVFFIYQMYKIGNHERTTVDSNIDYDNSTLIINNNKFTYIFDVNGVKKEKTETITGKVDVNILNKFETVIIKNPKCKEYTEEEFDKSDIKFINSHEYVDGHRDDLHLKYR